MDWITDQIAIGNIDDALSAERLRMEGVTAVLGLCDFPTFSPALGFAWQRVELFDGEGNSIAELRAALQALDAFVEAGHRVLVHCREGVSRAPFVTACYLAGVDGDFDVALETVSRRRRIANPHPGLIALWNELNATVDLAICTNTTGERNDD